MEVIYVDTIDYVTLNEDYQGNIIVPKEGKAIYVLDKAWYFIPQRLLDEIVFLQNLDPVNIDTDATDFLEEEDEIELRTNTALSIEDILNLAIIYSIDDMCKLRKEGLI